MFSARRSEGGLAMVGTSEGDERPLRLPARGRGCGIGIGNNE